MGRIHGARRPVNGLGQDAPATVQPREDVGVAGTGSGFRIALARPLFLDNGEDFVLEIELGQVIETLAGHGLYLGLAAAGRDAQCH
jgi:hypothetical protein